MIYKIRIHPIYIFDGIKKFLFLLIIPLLRGCMYYIINGNIYYWVKGSWIDISIVMIIIGLSMIRWYKYYLSIGVDKLVLTYGLFVEQKLVINKNDISYIVINIPFYYKLINAMQLNIQTFDENSKLSRFNIIITKQDFNLIKHNCLGYLSLKKNKVKNISLTNTLQTTFLSLIMSNSFAGIVFISTFISTSSKILGYQLENQLYGRFTILTKKLAFGFPPAGAAITYVLIIGWLIAFVRNLILYVNFRLERNGNYLITSTGLLSNKIEYINLKNIDYIDIMQNIFTRLINLCSVFINICGNINSTKHKIVAIQAINEKNLISNVSKIFDQSVENLNQMKVKPNKTSFIRYIKYPVIMFLFIYLTCNMLKKTYLNWYEFLSFINLMSGIICSWLFLIAVINFFTCGISYHSNNYIIKYSCFFRFHTVIINKNRISKVKIKQSMIQKFFNKSDIIIYSYSNKSKNNLKCKNIDISSSKKLLDQISSDKSLY